MFIKENLKKVSFEDCIKYAQSSGVENFGICFSGIGKACPIETYKAIAYQIKYSKELNKVLYLMEEGKYDKALDKLLKLPAEVIFKNPFYKLLNTLILLNE